MIELEYGLRILGALCTIGAGISLGNYLEYLNKAHYDKILASDKKTKIKDFV
tara:strand:+ start:114 stop:269 length:156 start_codon:yes stop_codon:yes gene_type:complete